MFHIKITHFYHIYVMTFVYKIRIKEIFQIFCACVCACTLTNFRRYVIVTSIKEVFIFLFWLNYIKEVIK